MPLTPADLSTLSRLLDDAMDLAPAQVDDWLAALPEAQQHLIPSLRAMLAQRASADGDDFMASGPSLEGVDASVAQEGDLVGAYRLIREIGHGGMGAVWLAERADGTLKRKVALKLPRLAWGAGLAERMARERDIGALLEHPNIARLYDAGVDDKGRPFLALEYIDGVALDVWCETKRLSVRERLMLFLQIARAVAYAHGRLVVHRDLKPSNVLVTADGQAHLLDFGIAKLLDDASVGSNLTQEQGRVLTPRYASPEQIAGETITVASDVYSLGVLLYEVLSGTSPYDAARPTVAAVEEAILHGAAARASSKAVDKGVAKQLRGELDDILAKAMRREPHERYSTADAFADDVDRYLRGAVVSARPSSLLYRAAKTLRQHRVGFAAAATMLISVLGGAGVAVVQAQRANAEADRARLVKEFVVDMFDTKSGPNGALAQMPAEALLERSASTIDRKFGGQPLLQAELYGVVSRMFLSMAKESQAVDFATRQVEALNSANANPLEIARATLSLGEMLNELYRNGDAEIRLRRVLELAGTDNGMKARAHAGLAFALSYISNDDVGSAHELDAAEALVTRGGLSPIDRATVLFSRANRLGDFLHKPDAAKPVFDAAIQTAISAEGPTSRLAMNARLEAAKVMVRQGRVDAGRAYLTEALNVMRSVGGSNDVNAALWESRVTGWMFSADAIPFADAMRVFDRNMAALRAQTWAVPPSTYAAIELRQGITYVTWGDVEHGFPLMNQAEANPSPEPVAQWWNRNNLIFAATESDHVDDVIPLGRELIDVGKGWQHGSDLQYSYYPLANAQVHAAHYDDAVATLAELDALPGVREANDEDLKNGVAPDDSRVLTALELGHADAVLELTSHLKPADRIHDNEGAWLARAAALCATGRPDEGLSVFDHWLPRLATGRYDASPQLVYWRARFGLCALAAGQTRRAKDAFVLARAAIVKQPGVAPHFKRPLAQLEASLAKR